MGGMLMVGVYYLLYATSFGLSILPYFLHTSHVIRVTDGDTTTAKKRGTSLGNLPPVVLN